FGLAFEQEGELRCVGLPLEAALRPLQPAVRDRTAALEAVVVVQSHRRPRAASRVSVRFGLLVRQLAEGRALVQVADRPRGVGELFDDDEAFRGPNVMARHASGEGTYRFFTDPLPSVAQRFRVEVYGPLAEIANRWAAQLGTRTLPETLDGLVEVCAAAGQHR